MYSLNLLEWSRKEIGTEKNYFVLIIMNDLIIMIFEANLLLWKLYFLEKISFLFKSSKLYLLYCDKSKKYVNNTKCIFNIIKNINNINKIISYNKIIIIFAIQQNLFQAKFIFRVLFLFFLFFAKL